MTLCRAKDTHVAEDTFKQMPCTLAEPTVLAENAQGTVCRSSTVVAFWNSKAKLGACKLGIHQSACAGRNSLPGWLLFTWLCNWWLPTNRQQGRTYLCLAALLPVLSCSHGQPYVTVLTLAFTEVRGGDSGG